MNATAEKLNNEGVRFFMQGNFSKAKQKYKDALKKEPNYATTLNNLGMLSLQEKEYIKAETYFQQAIEQKSSATYLLNLGHALANQKKFKEAEKMYKESINLKLSSIMAWKSLASLFQFTKQYSNAIQSWQYIIENIDNDNEYKIQLGKDFIALKDYDSALAVFHEALNNSKNRDLSLIHI